MILFAALSRQRSTNLPKKTAFALGTEFLPIHLQENMQNELLNHLETTLRSMLDQVRTQIAEKPIESLQRRRDGNTWNALECIAHLNVFLEMYMPRLEQAIHRSKARRWNPGTDVRYTRTGRRIVKRANIANKKPRRTPKRYDFGNAPLGNDVIKTFLINSERLLRNIQAARAVDLNRAKIGWGPSSFFKLTLGNVLEWLVLHGQRHVQQATTAVNQQPVL